MKSKGKSETPPRSMLRWWLGLSRPWRRAAMLGTLLACIFLVGIFAPLLTPQDPFKVSVRDRLKPRVIYRIVGRYSFWAPMVWGAMS